MREKISNLTKKVLPFLAIPIIASSAYCAEKKLDKNFLRVNPEIPKIEEIDYSRENNSIFYKNFPKKESSFNKEYLGTSTKKTISLIYSGNTGSYHFKRNKYNEDNSTLGFKMSLKKGTKIFGTKLRTGVSLSMAKFTNSYGYDSRAILLNGEFTCSNTSINFCGGLSAGVVDGYPQSDFKPTLVTLPYSSINYKDIVGIDIYIATSAIAFAANVKLLEF